MHEPSVAEIEFNALILTRKCVTNERIEVSNGKQTNVSSSKKEQEGSYEHCT